MINRILVNYFAKLQLAELYLISYVLILSQHVSHEVRSFGLDAVIVEKTVLVKHFARSDHVLVPA